MQPLRGSLAVNTTRERVDYVFTLIMLTTA